MEKSDSHLIVVVEDDNKRQVGLVIDELIGRQQIVIKPLGESMRDIPGISGGGHYAQRSSGADFGCGRNHATCQF